MRRGAFSLLEMITATAMMATVMTSSIVVVRSGCAIWNAQESDIEMAENANAVLRHFVREMRQATAITAISAAGSTTGSLSFTTSAGTTGTWSFSGGTVMYNNGSANQPLAPSINELNFIGYKADGITQTAVVDDIQVVKCTIKVTLLQGSGTTRIVSCRAWIRSW